MIGYIPGPKAMVKYELRALKQIGLIGCGGFGTVTLQRFHSQFLRWQDCCMLLPEYFSGAWRKTCESEVQHLRKHFRLEDFV